MRAVDEFAITHIDAGVVAPAGMPKGNNVANLHVFHIIDAFAYYRLLTGGAGQVYAHAFVGPTHKAGAVKPAGGHAPRHIWGADCRPSLAQKLLVALLFVIIKGCFVRAAKALFCLSAIGIWFIAGFLGAAKCHGTNQSQHTQFQIFTHRHSVWVAPQQRPRRVTQKNGNKPACL